MKKNDKIEQIFQFTVHADYIHEMFKFTILIFFSALIVEHRKDIKILILISFNNWKNTKYFMWLVFCLNL